MLTVKINSDITVYICKEQDADTYEVISSDNEGHEGRLAYGLVTLEELFNVLKEYFDV